MPKVIPYGDYGLNVPGTADDDCPVKKTHIQEDSLQGGFCEKKLAI
jgi:hypothetical protein